MNPQNYPPQVGNQQPPEQSAKTWFDSLDAPAGNPPPLPSAPKKSKKPAIIISTAVIFVAALLILAGYLCLSSASSLACLTTQNYKELLGVEAQDTIDAKTNFYTTAVSFDAGSTTYDELTEKDTTEIIKSIGALYKNHHASTSIVISLSADYVFQDAAASAAERIEKLKSALVDAGVDAAAIKTAKPKLITQESDSETDDLPAQIRITSSQDCRE